MYIAICDDEKTTHDGVKSLLLKYMAQKTSPQSMSCNIKRFFDGEGLVDACRNNEHYDLIFLDVFMGDMDGISTARAIRALGLKTPIVFLTTSRDFAVESYQVSAFSYMLKPVTQAGFFAVMDKFSEQYRPVRICVGNLFFSVSDLVYAESADKRVELHFLDGTAQAVKAKFDELTSILNFPNLLHCHRCYIINLDHVKRVCDGYFLTVTNERVLIRQKAFAAIKKAYYEYILSK